MNIKRILAAVSASVVAVSSMAVVASAKDVKISWSEGGNDGWWGQPAGNTIVFLDEGWLDGIDVSLIDKVEVDFEANTKFNGTLGGTINDQWVGDQSENEGDATWTLECGGGLAADSLQLQIWGMGGVWSDEVQGPVDGTVTLTAYRLLDKDGNEIKEGAVAKPVEFKSDDTKIEVSAPADAFAEGTKFSATAIADQTDDTQFAFDLKFTKDDKEVQPTKAVTVKIPVPEKIKDAKDIFVFHVEDGKNVKVDCKVKDGFVEFSASKFSTFIVSTKDLNAGKEEESKPEESKPVVNEDKLVPNHERPAPGEVHTGPNYERPVPGTSNSGNNGGNSGNSGDNSGSDNKPADPSNPSNPNTGVAIAFAPALLAGAAVVVAKKRK